MLLEVYAQLYKHWVPETALTLTDRADAVVRRLSSSGRESPTVSRNWSGGIGAQSATLSPVRLRNRF